MVSAMNALSLPPCIAACDGAPHATIAAPIPNAASGAIAHHSFSLVARLCALTHECGAALGNARNRKGETQVVVFPVAGLPRSASSIASVAVGVSLMGRCLRRERIHRVQRWNVLLCAPTIDRRGEEGGFELLRRFVLVVVHNLRWN